MDFEEGKRVLIKNVTVGYVGAGKRSLLITYTTGKFPSEYTPTVFDNYQADGDMDGKKYQLGFFDTGGGEDYERLRPLSYPQTDVFTLLFDVSNSDERFNEIHSYWWAELHHHCPDVPIVLVASKIDLRKGDGSKTISKEEGQVMSERIGAAKYMEISSLENLGLNELYKEVITLGYEHSVGAEKRKRKKCIIL